MATFALDQCETQLFFHVPRTGRVPLRKVAYFDTGFSVLSTKKRRWCHTLKGRRFASRIWQHKHVCEIAVYMGCPAPYLCISIMENCVIPRTKAQFEIHRLPSCRSESSSRLFSLAMTYTMEVEILPCPLWRVVSTRWLTSCWRHVEDWKLGIRLPHLATEMCLWNGG